MKHPRQETEVVITHKRFVLGAKLWLFPRARTVTVLPRAMKASSSFAQGVLLNRLGLQLPSHGLQLVRLELVGCNLGGDKLLALADALIDLWRQGGPWRMESLRELDLRENGLIADLAVGLVASRGVAPALVDVWTGKKQSRALEADRLDSLRNSRAVKVYLVNSGVAEDKLGEWCVPRAASKN